MLIQLCAPQWLMQLLAPWELPGAVMPRLGARFRQALQAVMPPVSECCAAREVQGGGGVDVPSSFRDLPRVKREDSA